MSLCLSDRRNRVHLPSNLDLSSEIDLMAQHQADREGVSLGFRDERVILAPEWPGGGARLRSKSKVSGYFKGAGQ